MAPAWPGNLKVGSQNSMVFSLNVCKHDKNASKKRRVLKLIEYDKFPAGSLFFLPKPSLNPSVLLR